MSKNKILAFALTFVLIISMILPMNEKHQIRADEEHTLSNPTKDSNGNTIWDCIYFGNYYQNDIEGKVKEPIKWRILKIDGNDAFLMADKSLDTKKWNETQVGVTWENSTLRSWLNGYGSDSNICGNDYSEDNFMETAFTEEEQNAIKSSFVENQHDPFENSPSGNDTYDKVYLLSYKEALNTEYGFSSDIYDGEARIVQNTPYAEAKLELPSWLSPCWWLRSHGDDKYLDNWDYYGHYAVNVYSNGFVYCNGCVVDDTGHTVRPVLHLDIQNNNLYSYAGIVNSGEADSEVTTEAQDNTTEITTTASETEQWNAASSTWTTDGTWNIWAGNGASAQYKGNGTLNDYYVNTITTTGDWSVQTNTIVTGLTAGTLYRYTITIESDKEGAYVGAKDDYSNSSLVYKTLSVGENTITGTFTAAQADAKLFLEMGNAANTGATFHITGVTVSECADDDSEGIPADGKWLGWFEAEGWASYTVSEVTSGYTLSNKNIGQNWYSIQTGIDNVKFKSGVDYTCAFTLTSDKPKQFKVDNRSNDGTVFTETAAGTWSQNGDGTYSYKYVGTYKNETASAQFINVRISLGYFTGEENYGAASTLNCTVSDFVIVPTSEYGKEPATTAAPTTAAPTTAAPTTVAPTTAAPTTVAPTTAAPTTVAPTTAAPTTVAPTTAVPTTAAPTMTAPTETTTVKPEDTTTAPTETTTGKPEETTTEVIIETSSEENTTSGDIKPSAPTGLVQISKGYFTWMAVSDAISYNFYVNGIKIGNTIISEYVAKSLFTVAGEYEIGVTSVNQSGVESEMTKIVIIIDDPEVETTTEETTTDNTVETTTEETTTDNAVETTTEGTTTDNTVETTSEKSTSEEKITTTQNVTEDGTQQSIVKLKAPARAKIKKISTKKYESNKIKISLKKMNGIRGYEVRVLKKKKGKKAFIKKVVRKNKFTIKSKKLRNRNNLYVKVRAFKLDEKGRKLFGKWSKVKKVKIKK